MCACVHPCVWVVCVREYEVFVNAGAVSHKTPLLCFSRALLSQYVKRVRTRWRGSTGSVVPCCNVNPTQSILNLDKTLIQPGNISRFSHDRAENGIKQSPAKRNREPPRGRSVLSPHHPSWYTLTGLQKMQSQALQWRHQLFLAPVYVNF